MTAADAEPGALDKIGCGFQRARDSGERGLGEGGEFGEIVVGGCAVELVACRGSADPARAGDPLADVEVLEARRILAALPAAAWPVISDHDLYARLAPNLSAVEVISDPDAPLRRRCVNTARQGWTETCTLWEQGRRFAVEIDTTDYPYPLTLMRGLWQVDPHPAGSRVTRLRHRRGVGCSPSACVCCSRRS